MLKAHADESAKLVAQARDDLYRVAIERAEVIAMLGKVKAERDEWKRRAEAAEARWKSVKETAIEAGLPEGVDTKSWLVAKLKNVVSLPKSFANLARGEDLAHGIATQPPQSEPHAHLDEDLLCEDA